MIAEIGTDVDALELYNELIKIATRYATFRANWPLLSRDEKKRARLRQDFLPQLRDNTFQYARQILKATRQNRRMA